MKESDLNTGETGAELFDTLLGGKPAEGHCALDVVSFELGQTGPVLSGVLWRLVLQGQSDDTLDIGMKLAVARSRKEGLLINPHMEAWLQIGNK